MNARRSFGWARLALPATLLALLAPAQVQAAAGTTTLRFSVPFGPVMFVPCANGGAGENVLFSGNVEGLIFVTTDAQGGTHFDTRLNAKGVVGVGQVTGDKYRGVEAEQHHFNFRGAAPFEATFASHLALIGPGPGNNFTLASTVHITFDASGVLTANVFDSSVSCT